MCINVNVYVCVYMYICGCIHTCTYKYVYEPVEVITPRKGNDWTKNLNLVIHPIHLIREVVRKLAKLI